MAVVGTGRLPSSPLPLSGGGRCRFKRGVVRLFVCAWSCTRRNAPVGAVAKAEHALPGARTARRAAFKGAVHQREVPVARHREQPTVVDASATAADARGHRTRPPRMLDARRVDDVKKSTYACVGGSTTRTEMEWWW